MIGTAHVFPVATAATFITVLNSSLRNIASPTGRSTSAAASATGLITSPATSATGLITSPTASATGLTASPISSNVSSMKCTIMQPS